MADEVYQIGDLQRRVVDLLAVQPHAAALTTLELESGLPRWALETGLEAARLARQAVVVGTVNGCAFWSISYELVRERLARERAAVAAIALPEGL